MTTAEIAGLILSVLAGGVIGAFYFWGLWWTVQHMAKSARPMLLLAVSSFLRITLAVLLLWLVARGDWQRLLAELPGFVLSRFLITYFGGSIKRATSERDATAPESDA